MNKEKENYELEDFLIDESFIAWARGKDTVNLYWENYCQNHPEKIQTIEQAKTVVKNLKIRDRQYSDHDIDRIKHSIERSILDAELKHLGKATPSRPRFMQWAMRAAASLAIIAVTYFAATYLVERISSSGVTDAVELVEKSTQTGQKLTIYLSDGSKVKLNYNSTIRYPKTFTDSNRVVMLQGEAFFEVAHDTSRPFRVITSQINTEVLGTTFNVQAYPESKTTDVVLVTGKVSVTSSGVQRQNYVLSPGQAAAYDKKSSALGVSAIDVTKATAWKDGIILFEKASQQEVFERLGNWYGVEFELQHPQGDSWQYTGQFDNMSLEGVLNSLSFVKGFGFTMGNDKVIIQFKK